MNCKAASGAMRRNTVVGALEKAGIRVLLTRNQSVTLYSDGNIISIKE